MTPRQISSITVCFLLLGGSAPAQSPASVVERPKGLFVRRPYREDYVPPARLQDNARLHGFLRAGKLYLTAQDAIAVALENNVDLEVARYGPIAAEWQYTRALAGGPLRGVPNGNSVVNQATSGQGVAGSLISAGLSNGNNGNGSSNTGGAIISQIGPVTQNLDPTLQNATAFSHITSPQVNTLQSQTNAIVDTHAVSNSVVQEGLLTGGYVQLSANTSYLKENVPTDILNPSVAPVIQIYARHNFLNAFGTEVNSRFIRVASKNRNIAAETFKAQVMGVVGSVVNQYWEVVAASDDIRSRQATLTVAEKFFKDTNDEVRLGGVARVEIYRAEAEFKQRQRELELALATKNQQDILLKSLLTHDGSTDPEVDAAEVVALDTVQVPDKDDLPPLRELLARALKNRPDVVINKMQDENAEISSLGTKNGLLPQLSGIGAVSASGLAGTAQPQADGSVPDPYFVGGGGTAFGQVFRNNFQSRRGALLFQGTIHNRVAQGDYGIEQLQLRQGDLITRRTMNQLVVDISNQIIAMRQARVRFSVAVDALALQTDLLSKERQKFLLGDSTISAVIAAQRSQAAAQSTEVGARASYNRAQLGLEQTLGETLERHHVSMSEALEGVVHSASVPPAR